MIRRSGRSSKEIAVNSCQVLLLVSCFAALVPGASAVWWTLLPNLKDYWSNMWNFNLLKSRPGDFPTVTPSVWSLVKPRPESVAPFTPPPSNVSPNQLTHFGPQNAHDVKMVPGGPPIHEHSRPPPQFGPVPSRPKQPSSNIPPSNIQGHIQFPFHIGEEMRVPHRPQVAEQGVTVPPSFQWTPIVHPTQPSRVPVTKPAPPMPELIPIYPDVLPGSDGQNPDSDTLPMFFVNPAVFEGLVFPASGLPVDASAIASLPIPSSKPGSTVWHTFENKHNVPGVPGTFHASLSLHYEPEISNEAKDPQPPKPATPPPTRRPSLQSLFKPTRPILKKRTDPTPTVKSTKVNPTTITPSPLPLTTTTPTEDPDLLIDFLETLPPLTPSTSTTEDLDLHWGHGVAETTSETSGDADWTYPEGNETSSNESNHSQVAIPNPGIDPRTKAKLQKRSLASWLLAAQDDNKTSTGTNCSLRQLLLKRHTPMKQQLSERTVLPLANTEKHVAHSISNIMAKVQTRGSSTDTTFLYRPPATVKRDDSPASKKSKNIRKLVRDESFLLPKRER